MWAAGVVWIHRLCAGDGSLSEPVGLISFSSWAGVSFVRASEGLFVLSLL